MRLTGYHSHTVKPHSHSKDITDTLPKDVTQSIADVCCDYHGHVHTPEGYKRHLDESHNHSGHHSHNHSHNHSKDDLRAHHYAHLTTDITGWLAFAGFIGFAAHGVVKRRQKKKHTHNK
ncbi:MAG: hypothetical protein ACMXYE_03725 [Candidatus Woesearchaeota archaeon]